MATTTAIPQAIIVDTREQRGYSFDNAISRKLSAGDYSVQGYEHRIAIERKSLDDWIGTVLRSRERFCRELKRLDAYDFAAVVIETTPQDILAGSYRSDVQPTALLGITTELMVRLRPVLVIFGGDRPHSRVLTERLLHFAVKRCEEMDRNSLAANELEGGND